MSDSESDIDWSKTTFDGVRREQLRRWCALTVRERLEALDAMTELTEHVRQVGAAAKYGAGKSQGT